MPAMFIVRLSAHSAQVGVLACDQVIESLVGVDSDVLRVMGASILPAERLFGTAPAGAAAAAGAVVKVQYWICANILGNPPGCWHARVEEIDGGSTA